MLSRYVVSQVKHNGWFLAGLALGLWLALVAVPLDDAPACAPAPASAPASAPLAPEQDDYEPQREERPDRASMVVGRSIQRPRYYSTELGMRAPLLAGVLAGAGGGAGGGAGPLAAAINTTAHLLQPALKFFITAGSRQASGGLANVVGFTDTREMLKPFHALKYLADNFLEEYQFFFLVSDAAYVNARRLAQLVSRLSASQDVYMGAVAEDDSHYCSLESGILLSNSVLRAVHGQLDWCVRNSYSAHHHENLGRCVLHAAHVACTTHLQGESYVSARLSEPLQLSPALADAVTARPVAAPARVLALHAHVSRVLLQRARRHTRALRAAVARQVKRHPAGFRNATWPGGLRADPGLAPPPPDSRFDHARWRAFNLTHAFMPDELRAVAPLDRPHKMALDAVWEFARAWALQRWGAHSAALVEGALRWEPAVALRYRLLLRLTHRHTHPHRADTQAGEAGAVDGEDGEGVVTLRQVEVVRALGAARLVPVPYVTESARLVLVLPVPPRALTAARAFLRRYEDVCLLKDRNTNLIIVLVSEEGAPAAPEAEEVRVAARALAGERGAALDVLDAPLARATDALPARERGEAAARAALTAALPRAPRDALILLADVTMEFNEDFLNRARMNTISGAQWYSPLGFARYATYAHPRAAAPDGSRPQHHTGRFSDRRSVAAFYRADYEQALSAWRAGGGSERAPVAAVLAAGAARCLRAPEPGLVLAPPPPPCAPRDVPCLRALRAAGDLATLDLGAKHALAKLLLEDQAERDR